MPQKLCLSRESFPKVLGSFEELEVEGPLLVEALSLFL